MSEKEVKSGKPRRRPEQPLIRRAWIDRDGKIISFHPIDAGQLLQDEDPAFWENVISLTHIGYRIQ